MARHVFEIGDRVRLINPKQIGLNAGFAVGDVITITELANNGDGDAYAEGYVLDPVWVDWGYIEHVS